VVSDNLQDAAKSMAAARNAQHSHKYITYPFRWAEITFTLSSSSTEIENIRHQ
jgi:hypothetical protein